jgi:3-oxoacyl-[acyl-carrier-protein] synthase-3
MPAVPRTVPGCAITGWGSSLPERVVTNAELEASIDTSDAWIQDRTGIRERRVGGTTAALSIASARKALDMAGCGPDDVDALILATTTPDRQVPGTSATVQAGLGLRCGAFDLNAACSGFVYALVAAQGMIATGAQRVLVIGTDTLSRITDWTDRNTAVLFADGSGAAVVEAIDGPSQLLSWAIDADGAAESALYAELGGHLKMEGKEVFRRAVRIMVDLGQQVLDEAGVTADDVALLVPHQANIRIIDAACQRLGIGRDRTAIVLDRTGNTSSASIPLALVDAVEAGRVADGDLVLLIGFGAGMTGAAALLRWGRP